MNSSVSKSHVSVLHLRNTSEPWTVFANNGYFKMNGIQYDDCNNKDIAAPLKEYYSRKQPSNLLKNREQARQLSPVKWRNKEVDGVYLETSGWIKISQVDKNRRRSYSDSGVEEDTAPAGGAATPIIEPPKKFSSNFEQDCRLKDKVASAMVANDIVVAVTTLVSSDEEQEENGNQSGYCSPSRSLIISPPLAFQDEFTNSSDIGKPSATDGRRSAAKNNYAPRFCRCRHRTNKPNLISTRCCSGMIDDVIEEKPLNYNNNNNNSNNNNLSTFELYCNNHSCHKTENRITDRESFRKLSRGNLRGQCEILNNFVGSPKFKTATNTTDLKTERCKNNPNNVRCFRSEVARGLTNSDSEYNREQSKKLWVQQKKNIFPINAGSPPLPRTRKYDECRSKPINFDRNRSTRNNRLAINSYNDDYNDENRTDRSITSAGINFIDNGDRRRRSNTNKYICEAGENSSSLESDDNDDGAVAKAEFHDGVFRNCCYNESCAIAMSSIDNEARANEYIDHRNTDIEYSVAENEIMTCEICGYGFDENDTECIRYELTGDLFHIECFHNKIIIPENGYRNVNPMYKHFVFDAKQQPKERYNRNKGFSNGRNNRIQRNNNINNEGGMIGWKSIITAGGNDGKSIHRVDYNSSHKKVSTPKESNRNRIDFAASRQKENFFPIIGDRGNQRRKFDSLPSRNFSNAKSTINGNRYNGDDEDDDEAEDEDKLVERVWKEPQGQTVSYNGINTREAKRKSSSLPKSFQRNDVLRKEIKYRASSGVKFSWYKNGFVKSLMHKTIATPSVMSETAPTTPNRDMPEKKKYGRLMKINQYSSTPSLDDNVIQNIGFDCDTRYLFKENNYTNKVKNEKAATLSNGTTIHSSCQNNISSGSNLSDRMIQKFCKSFSWRFLKKMSSDEPDNIEANTINGYDSKLIENNTAVKKHNYRFGPLSWRCSKERKGKLSNSQSIKSDETESNTENTLADKVNEGTSAPKQDTQTLVRRTLSDLNGYRDIVKLKTTCSLVPIKYRPPVPVAMKKHRQYELRRTLSQPLLTTSKFSPALERKTPANRVVQSEDERVVFSEDDMMSDSGSSLPSRKNSLEQGINEDIVIYSEAVWDHVAMESEELPFRAGDVIEVYSALDRDWWWGTCCGKSGWFPSDFVRLRVNQEVNSVGSNTENCFIDSDCNVVAPYCNDQVRSRIVCELINTETDFVKVLKNISQAYISECRKAQDLFTNEQISTMFGNWEQLLSYQSEFLKSLEESMNWDAPYKSCVGVVFLKHHEDFCIYSDYCNNHPLSIATLQQLYQNPTYSAFFEKCRIKGELIEIPLDGFLLTPVQRICKYPLQLAELLKYTDPNHEDYEDVKCALETMKDVAVLINERKRRMESLEKLILWQQRVDGWEGENLIERSSQLIHQSEVTKIATGTFITNAMLFLFDHQLIYCKKDILKKNFYIYKGRMVLDNSEVIDVPDGKDNVLGFNVRNGIKVQNGKLHKWMLFCCRSQKDKSDWLEAFNKERNLIFQDEQNKLKITPTDRNLASITAAACSRRHTFVKHADKKFKRGTGRSARINNRNGSSSHLSRKVGTWFIFGANRKNHRRLAGRL